MRKYILFLMVISMVLLAGCTAKVEPAVLAVENYLKALVAQDATQLSNLSCKDWEETALLEMDSFQAVKPELQDLSCSLTSSTDSTAEVNCTGKIVTTYDTEQRDFDLSVQTYTVQQENGEWRVCGYH